MPRGTFVALVGPNGSGKSSLLRCVYRVIRPDAGHISVDGRGVWDVPARELARDVGVVLQERPSETSFTVHEMVLMGRGPHKKLLARDTAQDLELVASALSRVGIASLAERPFESLSGGEKQRVIIARALAQTPRLLVLDEPTTHLDIGHQHETLRLFRALRSRPSPPCTTSISPPPTATTSSCSRQDRSGRTASHRRSDGSD